MPGAIERLAYEAALRALDKQERLVEELRARTGICLAASSFVMSFLAERSIAETTLPAVGTAALTAFITATTASIYVLAPKRDLIFSLSGPDLYELLHPLHEDLAEAHRRLCYALHAFWQGNDALIARLVAAYRAAATALVLQIVLLFVLIDDTLV